VIDVRYAPRVDSSDARAQLAPDARHHARVETPIGSESPGERSSKMHPMMFDWWRHARRASYAWAGAPGCGPSGCGPSEGGQGWETRFAGPADHDGDFGGGPFGVRRPLRFLAHKLELDDRQVGELARILSDLKTERAQAAVDHRRSTS